MRVCELIEARKNPEQNPKTSINRIVYDAVKSAKGSEIGGTANLFISFTSVDKLGINPKSKYKTPLGIYAYPGEYVVKSVGAHRSMRSLPFAGDSPHVNLFKARGNIINIATISVGEVREYYKKLATLWSETSGESWKTSVDQIESLINDASSKAKFSDIPGGRLWYVTMMAAKELFADKWRTEPPVAWNKLFRSIGIDGVVDYAPDGGTGIIHTSEPSQAVFFTINSIGNVQRHSNLYSPASGSLDARIKDGQGTHQDIVKAAAALKQIKTPEEALEYLENNGFQHIRLIKDQATRSYILKKHPRKIRNLKHPTLQDQKIALFADPSSAYRINNPIESVFLELFYRDPGSITPSDLAAIFPNASQEMQLVIAKHDPDLIREFVLPSETNHAPKTYPAVIKYVLEAFAEQDRPIPLWLMRKATKFGIPFKQKEDRYTTGLRKEIEVQRQRESETIQAIEKVKNEWATMIKDTGQDNPNLVDVLMQIMDEEVEKLNNQLKHIREIIERAEQELNRALTGG